MLSEEEKISVSMGFNWTPDTDFDKFVQDNPDFDQDELWGMYQLIESRYLEKMYN